MEWCAWKGHAKSPGFPGAVVHGSTEREVLHGCADGRPRCRRRRHSEWMPRAIAALLLGLLALASGPAPTRALPPSLVAEASWAWPVDAPYAVVRPFIAPATPYSAGHRGIDVRAAGGVVYAPAAGTVIFARVVVDRPVLSIRHADGVLSSYEPVESALVAGDAVQRGDVLGTVLPGHCASPCLHLGVRVDGEYVSPLLLLGGLPRSVLLPTRRGRSRPTREGIAAVAPATRTARRSGTSAMARSPCAPAAYRAVRRCTR